MNFNQLVLEALSPIKGIKRLTGKEAILRPLPSWIALAIKKNGGWLAHYNDEHLVYFYDDGELCYISADQRMADYEDALPEDERAIRSFEILNGLKRDVRNTWEDILS
jgi:hypothetical protein